MVFRSWNTSHMTWYDKSPTSVISWKKWWEKSDTFKCKRSNTDQFSFHQTFTVLSLAGFTVRLRRYHNYLDGFTVHLRRYHNYLDGFTVRLRRYHNYLDEFYPFQILDKNFWLIISFLESDLYPCEIKRQGKTSTSILL